MHARRRELQHPADVCRRHEVPGGTHHVRAEDLPFVERTLNLVVRGTLGHPQAQSPPRGRILLRLDSTKPLDDIRRLAVFRICDALVVESLLGYCGVHTEVPGRDGRSPQRHGQKKGPLPIVRSGPFRMSPPVSS